MHKKLVKIFILTSALALLFSACNIPPAEKKIREKEENDTVKIAENQQEAKPAEKEIKQNIPNDIMFSSPQADFAFVYPQDKVILSSSPYLNAGRDKLALYVQISKIEDLENPEKATEEKEALEGGDFGKEDDFAYSPSKKVYEVGNRKVKEYMVFSRNDICSATFERKAVFYNEGYRVEITLLGNKDKITKSMEKYFTRDRENCGQDPVWVPGGQDSFYQEIISGEASEEARQWYDVFESVKYLLQINYYKGASAGYNRVIDNRDYQKDEEFPYEITIAYPELFSSVHGGENLNQYIIEENVEPVVADFKDIVDRSRGSEAINKEIGYLLTIDYSIFTYTNSIASLTLDFYPYTGGAHGLYYFQTVNYDFENNKLIGLEEIFKPGSGYLEFLSEYCFEDIKRQMEDMGIEPDLEWIRDGTEPVEENYSHFLITAEGLVIKFLPYQVGPWASGDFSVTIPYGEIRDESVADKFSALALILKIAAIEEEKAYKLLSGNLTFT